MLIWLHCHFAITLHHHGSPASTRPCEHCQKKKDVEDLVAECLGQLNLDEDQFRHIINSSDTVANAYTFLRCFATFLFNRTSTHIERSTGGERSNFMSSSILQAFSLAKSHIKQCRNVMLPWDEPRVKAIRTKLVKALKTRENETGFFAKAAPSLLKFDLKCYAKLLYSPHGKKVSNNPWQDAGLACYSWYIFGRSSDCDLLRKSQVSLTSCGIMVKFTRPKTSRFQGLHLVNSLYWNDCPIFGLASILLFETTPMALFLNMSQKLQPLL